MFVLYQAAVGRAERLSVVTINVSIGAVSVVVAIRGGRRLQPADGGVFLFPAVKTRDEVAAELNDGGMRRDTAFDLAQFVPRLSGPALLDELVRGKDDLGVAVVEG